MYFVWRNVPLVVTLEEPAYMEDAAALLETRVVPYISVAPEATAGATFVDAPVMGAGFDVA